jgi:TolB-like protein
LWKAELDSLNLAYQEAEAEFKAQQPMLSEDALRAIQAELTAMRRQKDAFAQDIWGEGGKVEAKHAELFSPVVDKMNEVIEEVALDLGVKIVLDASTGGILYSDVDMDITSSVIEELNREYVAFTGAREKKVAVLSFHALDEKSQSDGLDRQVRGIVVRVVEEVKVDLDLEIVPEEEVNPELERYGFLFTSLIKDDEAINIASNMDADYAYYGTVEQQAGEVTIRISLIKPAERKKYPTEEATLSEDDISTKLTTTVNEIMGRLQAYLYAEKEQPE